MSVEVVHTIAAVRERVAAARRRGQRVGFVPTMGALHRGHASLIAAARSECDFVVASIFVNPLQFGPHEDFERYPRTLEKDVAIVQAEGGDLVFAPNAAEMYPKEPVTFVEVTGLTEGLCGAARPGHFRGVTTVVTKLFQIVQPDVAYFGQKDAQQAAVIVRMTEDLCMPIRIAVCPTVRESDGLALSSRNAYLSAEERAAAPVIYQALLAARQAIEAGEKDGDRIRSLLERRIAAEPLARLDYAAVVDGESLRAVSYIQGKVLLALAAYFGKTRLIDNLPVVAAG